MGNKNKSIYFSWLEVLVDNYEKGDDAGRKFWNDCIEKYQPEGFCNKEVLEEYDQK